MNHKQSSTKSSNAIDAVVVIVTTAVSTVLILAFHFRFLTSTLLYFGIPSLYLFVRRPKNIHRISAALALGFIFSLILDLLAEFNSAWSWAPRGQLLFNFKFLGIVPVDVLIWYILWLAFTVVFYEHFYEHDHFDKVSIRFKKALIGFSALLSLVILCLLLYPSSLRMGHAYLILGLVGGLPPLVYLAARNLKLLGKLMKASLFPIFLFLVFELTALKLDQWRFPGQYFGTVQLFGLTFPIEEFFFWIIMGTSITLSYYELLVDDER